MREKPGFDHHNAWRYYSPLSLGVNEDYVHTALGQAFGGTLDFRAFPKSKIPKPVGFLPGWGGEGCATLGCRTKPQKMECR